MRPFVRHYDTIYGDKDYGNDVDAFEHLLGRALTSAKVLEIGAGTGAQSLLLAKRGAEVTAVEIDPDFAKVLARKVGEHERVTVHFGDVRTVAADGFDAAAAFFHVLNYIDDYDDLICFLRAVARRLKPDAPFVADIWNGDVVLTDPPRREVRRKTNLNRAVTQSIEPRLLAERRVELAYEIEIGPLGQAPERFTEILRLRLWLREELERAFAEAGFEEFALYDYRAFPAPATSGSWRVWLHARQTRRETVDTAVSPR